VVLLASIPSKRLEISLKTVGNHDYPKVNFSHPLGLTVLPETGISDRQHELEIGGPADFVF